MKWWKERATRKAVITVIIAPLFSTPPLKAPLGILLWWTAVKITVQQTGYFLSNCCCWFPLCPQSLSQNCQDATPLLVHSFNFHELSPAIQFPAHAMHDKHSHPCFFCNPEIHEQLRIQLFFMRGKTEIIGLPCNGLGLGRGIMAVKRQAHRWITVDSI